MAKAVQLYTLGYEGTTIGAFVRKLKNAQVGVVIDVRERASSRKADFAKSRLSQRLARSGVRYRHCPAVGNPFRDEDDSFRKFQRHLRRDRSGITELRTLIRDAAARDQVVALMCVCGDAKDCHRGILVRELRGMKTVHL